MIHIKNFISKINTEKKVTILIVSILLVFVILMNSTYSLLVQNNETNEIDYTTGILQISSEAINNSVTLTNSIPMSDADGAALVPYTFRITNVGNLNYEFDVKFLSTTTSNQITAQYIKIKVNDAEITTLNNLTNGIILEDVTLAPNESILVDLRVWLSISTPNSQIGKQFSGKVTTEGYAVYTEKYDDIIIENMPIPTGTYTVDTSSCEDVTMTYDYTKKGFRISNVLLNSKVSCSPTYAETTRTSLASYISSLITGTSTSVSSTSNSDGSTLNKITLLSMVEYRYRGTDPNNYIWFNDELWRIIGVFNEKTHGITGTNLVKLIRNDSIGAYMWNNVSGTNFPDSTIYKMLNIAYYNSIDGTATNYCSYVSSGSNISTSMCDFSGRGIKNEYEVMIEPQVNWYLGGAASAGVTASNMYSYERGSTVSGSNDVSTYAAGLTNTPIGLMYASDYGYGASCSSSLSGFNTASCVGKDWLDSSSYEWLLTHSTSGQVFFVDTRGYVDVASSQSVYSVRPVLYLKSSVYHISGTGSKTDPYIIGID